MGLLQTKSLRRAVWKNISKGLPLVEAFMEEPSTDIKGPIMKETPIKVFNKQNSSKGPFEGPSRVRLEEPYID